MFVRPSSKTPDTGSWKSSRHRPSQSSHRSSASSGEAIQFLFGAKCWIASLDLAMTKTRLFEDCRVEPGNDRSGLGDNAPFGASVQHPLGLGAVERKSRHVDFEFLAAFCHHLITPGHEARRRRQGNAGGVFEAFAGREHRLFADHALAADFLLAAGGIRNDPVPGAQLHGLVAGIGDGNGVGPEILPVLHGRPFREEIRLHGHFDIAGHGAVHAGSIVSLKTSDILSDRFRRTNCNRTARATFSIAVSPQLGANRAVTCSAGLCYLAAMLAERIGLPWMR